MPENRLYQKLTFLNKRKGQPAPEDAVPLDADTLNALSQAIYDIETELIQAKEALAALQNGSSGSSSDINLIEGGEFAGILERIAATGRRMNGPDDEPLSPIDTSKIGVTARELGGSPLPLGSNGSMMEAGIYCYDEDTNETVYMVDMMDKLTDTMRNGDVMQALSDYFGNPEDPSEITVSQMWEFFDDYNEENDLGLRPAQLKLLGSFLWVQMQASRFEENDSDEPEYMQIIEMIHESRLSLSYGAQISTLGQIVFDKLIRNGGGNSDTSFDLSAIAQISRLIDSGDVDSLQASLEQAAASLPNMVGILYVLASLGTKYPTFGAFDIIPRPIISDYTREPSRPAGGHYKYYPFYVKNYGSTYSYPAGSDDAAPYEWRSELWFKYYPLHDNDETYNVGSFAMLTPKSLRAYIVWTPLDDYDHSMDSTDLEETDYYMLTESQRNSIQTYLNNLCSSFSAYREEDNVFLVAAADSVLSTTSNENAEYDIQAFNFTVDRSITEKLMNENLNGYGALGVFIAPDMGTNLGRIIAISRLTNLPAYPITWCPSTIYKMP